MESFADGPAWLAQPSRSDSFLLELESVCLITPYHSVLEASTTMLAAHLAARAAQDALASTIWGSGGFKSYVGAATGAPANFLGTVKYGYDQLPNLRLWCCFLSGWHRP